MKKVLCSALSFVLLAAMLLSLSACNRPPHKKSFVSITDYKVSYTFVNAYGEEVQYTVGLNRRDYEDDYYFYSDGTYEVIEKAPHGGGFSTFWQRNVQEDKNAPFVEIERDGATELDGLKGLMLHHLGVYIGSDNPITSGGMDWKRVALTEIDFTDELQGLENGALCGRDVTFYSLETKSGPAIVALDNEYAFVMYFILLNSREPLNKEAAVEKNQYSIYKGPFTTLICTSCVVDDAAPIIKDMLP